LTKHLKTSPGGTQLQFELPRYAKMIRGSKDIDYQVNLVTFRNGSKPLQIWYGPMVSPLEMEIELTIQSVSFEERSIRSFTKSGQIIGYDQCGKTPDGLLWRSADFPGLSASVSYKGVSDEEAATYDRIIDSACQLLQQSH